MPRNTLRAVPEQREPELPPELAKVRDAYGRTKIATVEFAKACQEAVEAGRKQYEIAEAAGCTKQYISRVFAAIKIAEDNQVVLSDLDPEQFAEYLAQAKETKAPDPEVKNEQRLKSSFERMSDEEKRLWLEEQNKKYNVHPQPDPNPGWDGGRCLHR